MAVDSSQEGPVSGLFGNLSWISPLAGAEQIVGSLGHVPYSDWRLGILLILLGPVFSKLSRRDWFAAYVGRLKRLRIIVLPEAPEAPAIDIIEEGRQKSARDQIRGHVSVLVQRRLIPSMESTDKALRACVGALNVGNQPLLDHLVRAYDLLLLEVSGRVGRVNVMALRSLQETLESAKPTPALLLEAFTDAAEWHFKICHVLHQLRLMPLVLLCRPPEIDEWKTSTEHFSAELRETMDVRGCESLRIFSGRLGSSVIPKTAPKIVPARYGHHTPGSMDHGIFVENIGDGPARAVSLQPIRLGKRLVRFDGPEVTQLKRGDGERFWSVSVEGPTNSVECNLFHPFRDWQQDEGDLGRETVGVIAYADFDGGRYATYYRLGIDVLNRDGGMVVEFIEQCRI